MGTHTAGREWFKPWRTITGEALAGPHLPQLQVMLEGMCERDRFLSLVRNFIVFEDDGGGQLAKKMAGYHQFHAVETAKFFPEEKGDRMPELSKRRNIVVIADEAHRSQYDFIDGYARHMRDALPNASFIGFTGTPIELEDGTGRFARAAKLPAEVWINRALPVTLANGTEPANGGKEGSLN